MALRITESTRSTWPGSYMFQIQSFSLISNFVQKLANGKCFQSPEFECNGHKWKLSVYPNGNKKVGVEDHISMYLVSTDADIDSVLPGIPVIFKMFVYDHIRDNFFTIQDNEVRRFHGLKKEWGFDRLISLERFKDVNNGYLMNDRCGFGVEIFVMTFGVRSGNLLMIQNPTDGIFTWKLNNFNFSTLSTSVTKEFQLQGQKWELHIYPNGDSSAADTHLSMYLRPMDGSKSYISCILRVRDQVNDKHFEKQFDHCFEAPLKGWGYRNFIPLSDLKDKSKGFILNHTLIAQVEVKLISN